MMKHPKAKRVDLAVRIYPMHGAEEKRSRRTRIWRCPEKIFVFDTETRIDETQRLTFGSYRLFLHGECIREQLFCADDLPAKERAVLERYVETHPAETTVSWDSKLTLLSHSQIVDMIFHEAYRCRCLLVGFNLSFDLARLAKAFGAARRRFAGGFSLELWTYEDLRGKEKSDKFRPRICVKHIDSKRALKGFTSRLAPDSVDLIPEDSESGDPEPGYIFRGHFLDARTLAFALTDQSHTLETACTTHGVEHGKQKVGIHGVVTEEYIDYNRRDVLATAELTLKLLAEFEKHPIALQAPKAYSPASIGKAYLRAMGIKPILERQPDFPRDILGYTESAFSGGRASAHVRKFPVPVVYVDFLSMYPTVNSLMDLWRFVIAQEIRVVRNCRAEILDFLNTITLDRLFKPDSWKHLTAFVKVIPDGDILPVRAKYGNASNDWQVGVNYLYAGQHASSREMWFSLPDVVAPVILTGKIPNIVDSFRIVAVGVQPGLKPTKLYGQIEIDPTNDDFFKLAIEQRRRLSVRTDLSNQEKELLGKFLKVLANAASYGIYAEMNRQESDKPVDVTCHGIDQEPFTCRVAHPDAVGEFCFPPLASLITGAARLMLALLEESVSDLGGTYAMEDTDSMAIVATKKGGLIACPGGPYKMSNGQYAIKALSWKQVDDIKNRFEGLNPYSRDAVPGSILKIEDENFEPNTRRQRQLYCLAISAKRYTLFLKDQNGEPVLLRENSNNSKDRWSQHGLGHLLNPTDPKSDDRDWIGKVWLNIIRRALKLPTQKLPFENFPAVGRITVSSPAVMKPLADFNNGKDYADQIKPFNFLLTCQVKPFGHPTGTEPERFHLIAPYDNDSRRWLKNKWIDQYTGKVYRITTEGHHGDRKTARVKTYGDVLLEYEFHPEAKCADAEGNPCNKQTIGLLARRHVQVDRIRFIGKESNALEDVEAGTVHSASEVYTEYCDPKRDEWNTKTLPALRKAKLNGLIRETGLSRRALLNLRAERSRPHENTRAKIVSALQRLGFI